MLPQLRQEIYQLTEVLRRDIRPGQNNREACRWGAIQIGDIPADVSQDSKEVCLRLAADIMTFVNRGNGVTSKTGKEDDDDIYGVNHTADGAFRVNIVKCQSCGARGNVHTTQKKAGPAANRDCYCCGIKSHFRRVCGLTT